MPNGEGLSSASVARQSIPTPIRKAIRSKLERRGRPNIEVLSSVARARRTVSAASGATLRPLTESQKECMIAAIDGALRGLAKGNLVDVYGAVHWWKTVRSLMARGVLIPARRRGHGAELTEVGMLAALWLEQEAREGI